MKRKMILVVVVSLVFIVLAGIAYSTGLSPAARAKNQLSLGNKYLQEGKYQEAILAFQKVIEIEPMNIPARLGLGKIYVATKEFNKAEIILKEVVGIDQKNITAREDLFNIYLSEGNNEEAEKILKEAILIKADLPELYLDLGNLYLKMNKIDQAINILSDGYKITKVLKIKELLDQLANTPPIVGNSNNVSSANVNTANNNEVSNNNQQNKDDDFQMVNDIFLSEMSIPDKINGTFNKNMILNNRAFYYFYFKSNNALFIRLCEKKDGKWVQTYGYNAGSESIYIKKSEDWLKSGQLPW